MRVRIKFRKYGVMRFIGHLDVMRFFQKVLRRAEIPVAFSGGFSPHMIMSFANPLGVGLTSEGEYFDLDLREPISSEEAVRRMNKQMVEGMEVLSFVEVPDDKKNKGMSIVAAADYVCSLRKGTFPSDWKDRFNEFITQDHVMVLKKTKKSEMEVDILPMIYNYKILDDSIYLFVSAGSVQNLKPELVCEKFQEYAGYEDWVWKYCRMDNYMNAGSDEDPHFVPLDALGKVIP